MRATTSRAQPIAAAGNGAADVMRTAVSKAVEHDMWGLGAELAYRSLMAFLPFLLFLAAASGMLTRALNMDNAADDLMQGIFEPLPDGLSRVLEGELQTILSRSQSSLLIFGLLATLLTGTAAIVTFMKALNRAFEVQDNRTALRKYGLALVLNVAVGTSFFAAFVIFLLGNNFGYGIADGFGLGSEWVTMLNVMRLPFAMLFLLVATAFLYWIGPSMQQSLRWVSPGAALFIVVWFLATWALGYYVSNVGNYTATYGALGAFIVLTVWLYITSLAALLGAEVNAALIHRTHPDQARV